MSTRDYVLIWSIEHSAWWRPGRVGYTHVLSEAGRYTAEEATWILTRANLVRVNECIIPIDALGLGAVSPPPETRHLGDLLQYLAGADPTYLRDLDALVRAHVANLVRR